MTKCYSSALSFQKQQQEEMGFATDLLQYGLAKDIYIADALEKANMEVDLRGLTNKTFLCQISKKMKKSIIVFIANGTIQLILMEELSINLIDFKSQESLTMVYQNQTSFFCLDNFFDILVMFMSFLAN